MKKDPNILPATENEIIFLLGESGKEMSPYDIQKISKKSYTGIARCCKNLEIDEYVSSREIDSSTGGKKLHYSLTIYGALYAIGYQFRIHQDQLVVNNDKDLFGKEYFGISDDGIYIDCIKLGLIAPNLEIISKILRNFSDKLNLFLVWEKILSSFISHDWIENDGSKISVYLYPFGKACWHHIFNINSEVLRNCMKIEGISLFVGLDAFKEGEKLLYNLVDPTNPNSHNYEAYQIVLNEYKNHFQNWELIVNYYNDALYGLYYSTKRILNLINPDATEFIESFYELLPKKE